MSLSVNGKLEFKSILSGSTTLGSAPTISPVVSAVIALANGILANQANKIYASEARSLNAASNEALDLNGVLTDVFGAAINFARVKLIFIRLNTVGATLEIGGAAANQFLTPFGSATDKIKLQGKNGFVCLYSEEATGYVVTAGTADQLKINNPGGAAITYDIVVVGCDA